MSGTINNAAPTLTRQPTSNGQASPTALTWFFQIVLVSGTNQILDFRSQQNTLQLQSIQSIKLDNSKGTTSLVVTFPNQDTLSIPAGYQAIAPVYVPNSVPVFTFSGNGTVGATLCNFQQPLAVWGASGSFTYTGSSLNVVDATVAGAIAAIEGSVAPGVASTASALIGGIYRSGPITLANGQQAARSVDVNGNEIVTSAPGTGTAPSAFAVATGGTAVNAFAANTILREAFIKNPNGNPVIYVDIVNAAQTSEPGTNGTTVALQPGQSFYISRPMTTAVSVNCATSATTFVAVNM
jgi:hypothetical protein